MQTSDTLITLQEAMLVMSCLFKRRHSHRHNETERELNKKAVGRMNEKAVERID